MDILELTQNMKPIYRDHIRERFAGLFDGNWKCPGEGMDGAIKRYRAEGLEPRDHLLLSLELIKPLEDDFYKKLYKDLEEIDTHLMEGRLIKRNRSEIQPLDELLHIYCECLESTRYCDAAHGGRLVEIEMPEIDRQIRYFLYHELSYIGTRMRARWCDEEYTKGVREPVKKKNSC